MGDTHEENYSLERKNVNVGGIGKHEKKVIDSIIAEKPWTAPFAYGMSIRGVANHFRRYYSEKFLYCEDGINGDRFLTPDEAELWIDDYNAVRTTSLVSDFMVLCTVAFAEYIEANPDEADVKIVEKYLAYYIDKDNTNFHLSVLNYLRGGFLVPASKFNADPDLLNTDNKVIVLSRGVVRPRYMGDYMTLSTHCRCPSPENAFEEEAEDAVRKFLLDIMSGDPELVAFLIRAMWATLNGRNADECMFFLYGNTTRNGKTTFLTAFGNALGLTAPKGYAKAMSPEFLLKSKYKARNANAAAPMIANLVGKRLVILDETDKDAVLDVNEVKKYTGRDPIETRGMYKEPFILINQATFWCGTNHLPKVDDETLFRSLRAWVIPFDRHFSDEEQDKTLKDKFENPIMRTAFLKVILSGREDYLQHGLNPPERVIEATKKWAAQNGFYLGGKGSEDSSIGSFTHDKIMFKRGAQITMSRLYEVYESYCKQYGLPVMSKAKVRMYYTDAAKDFDIEYTGNGVNRTSGFKGMNLRSSESLREALGEEREQ